VPETLRTSSCTLDLGALVPVATALILGAAEEGAQGDPHPRHIICLDELTRCRTRGAEGRSTRSILKHARPAVSCDHRCHADEYRKHLEKDPALERRSSHSGPGPTLSHTIEILRAADRYEAHHRVSITDGALVPPHPGDRYVNDGSFDKAIDLIDEAGPAANRRIRKPPDLREFDERIAQTRRERSRDHARDFEKGRLAAGHREKLAPAKADREKQWKPAT